VRHQCEIVAAIRERSPELFVNARTDTYWLSTPDATVGATARRLSAYVEAGAQGVFVPGVRDLAAVGALAAECPAPLNVLFDPRGATVAELAAAGVRRVSLGSLLFRTALGAALDAAGAVRAGRPVTHPCPSYQDVQALLPRPAGTPRG
jgi:2-methylisocitrate lyase-like PEP mutase family enzyme